MLSILKNAWYATAFSEELADAPLARKLAGEDAVIFRTADGTPAMLRDRCPHRFAPLSEGQVEGDTIRCPYHGLRFDRAGRCVHNPHLGKEAPFPAADTRAWPVMERYGVIWFWPGDPAAANPDSLPRVAFLEDPEYALVRGRLHVRGHYELVVDNLLDLSHAAFIHPQFGGGRHATETVLKATKQRLERRERSIVNHRMRSGLGPSSAHVKLFGMDPDVPVHSDTTMTWYPPAFLDFAVGSWEMDKDRDSGVHIPQLHTITPETEFTSHYFFINGRNRRQDEPEVDKALLDFFDLAFRQQDEPMIELVQKNMGAVSDINQLNPILLATDAAPVSARRMLAALIAEERAAEGAKGTR